MNDNKIDLCTATLAYWGRNNAVRKEQLPDITCKIYGSRVLTTLYSLKKLNKKTASDFNRAVIIDIRHCVHLN